MVTFDELALVIWKMAAWTKSQTITMSPSTRPCAVVFTLNCAEFGLWSVTVTSPEAFDKGAIGSRRKNAPSRSTPGKSAGALDGTAESL